MFFGYPGDHMGVESLGFAAVTVVENAQAIARLDIGLATAAGTEQGDQANNQDVLKLERQGEIRGWDVPGSIAVRRRPSKGFSVRGSRLASGSQGTFQRGKDALCIRRGVVMHQ